MIAEVHVASRAATLLNLGTGVRPAPSAPGGSR